MLETDTLRGPGLLNTTKGDGTLINKTIQFGTGGAVLGEQGNIEVAQTLRGKDLFHAGTATDVDNFGIDFTQTLRGGQAFAQAAAVPNANVQPKSNLESANAEGVDVNLDVSEEDMKDKPELKKPATPKRRRSLKDSEALLTIVQESEHFPTSKPFFLTIRDLYSEESRDVPIYLTLNKRESDIAISKAAFDFRSGAKSREDEEKEQNGGNDGGDEEYGRGGKVVKDKEGRPLFTVTLRYYNVMKECDGLCEETMQLPFEESGLGNNDLEKDGIGYGMVRDFCLLRSPSRDIP